MTREDARADINARPLTDFYPLTPSRERGKYVCPICGSGTGQHSTGALSIDPRTKRVNCFAGNCFASGTYTSQDTLGALRILWQCEEHEAIARAGYTIDHQTPAPARPAPSAPAQKPTQPATDYTAQYQQWHEALTQAPAVLEEIATWGIDRATVDRFMLGLAPQRMDGEEVQCLIIPRSRTAYTARRFPRNCNGQRYASGGSRSDLFNAKALENNNGMPIVLVEGEIDALASFKHYPHVIALGSVTNAHRAAQSAREHNPQAAYIIALDNDEPGRTAQQQIAAAFTEYGIRHISADTAHLFGGAKDPGEADTKIYAERLTELVNRAATLQQTPAPDAPQQPPTPAAQAQADRFDSFLQAIQTDRFKPLPCGIGNLDAALNGGFIRQSVVLLGAAPGMGKTALITQICEGFAADGQDVLYVNLEMSDAVMYARSLSRIAAASSGAHIGFADILRMYDMDAGRRDVVLDAISEYRERIAPHMRYTGGAQTHLQAILATMRSETARLGHAPIVCIDYLQLLTGGAKDDPATVIKSAMQELKQWTNDNNSIVFVITATNREAMKTGEAGLNSGRDSSNIEYGADLHLGMEYAAISDTIKPRTNADGSLKLTRTKGLSGDDIRAIKRAYAEAARRNVGLPVEEWPAADQPTVEAYNRYCTRIAIRVNKNRYGSGGESAILHFNGAAMRFDNAQFDASMIAKVEEASKSAAEASTPPGATLAEKPSRRKT